MKLLRYVLFSCLLWGMFGLTMASTRNEYKDSLPQEILDDIVDHEESDIIKTKLDGSYHTQVIGAGNKIAGTLESVRQNISYYLQRAAYIGLAAAVTLIIYNGLLLVISPLSPEQASKVKTRMLYITLGALLITWFYFVLKIVLAVYYDIFVS